MIADCKKFLSLLFLLGHLESASATPEWSQDSNVLANVDVNGKLYDVRFGDDVVGNTWAGEQLIAPGWRSLADAISTAVVSALNGLSEVPAPNGIAGCADTSLCVLFLPDQFFPGNPSFEPAFSDDFQAQVRPTGAEICANCGTTLAPDTDTSADIRYTLMTFAESSTVVEAILDIKPGREKNRIHRRSRGVLTVAVLSTDDFDALQLDALSVEFGPAGASEIHGRGHVRDVDADGDFDMLLHFKIRKTGMRCGDVEATLTGSTFSGTRIILTDHVRMVGCKKEAHK